MECKKGREGKGRERLSFPSPLYSISWTERLRAQQSAEGIHFESFLNPQMCCWYDSLASLVFIVLEYRALQLGKALNMKVPHRNRACAFAWPIKI